MRNPSCCKCTCWNADGHYKRPIGVEWPLRTHTVTSWRSFRFCPSFHSVWWLLPEGGTTQGIQYPLGRDHPMAANPHTILHHMRDHLIMAIRIPTAAQTKIPTIERTLIKYTRKDLKVVGTTLVATSRVSCLDQSWWSWIVQGNAADWSIRNQSESYLCNVRCAWSTDRANLQQWGDHIFATLFLYFCYQIPSSQTVLLYLLSLGVFICHYDLIKHMNLSSNNSGNKACFFKWDEAFMFNHKFLFLKSAKTPGKFGWH